MAQSPSCEANWFAASQEIPRISRNPKVHYRTHKRPPPVSILGQPNPVHILTSYLLEIHPNINHPSTSRSLQLSLSLLLLHQDPIHPPLLTHTRQLYWNNSGIVRRVTADVKFVVGYAMPSATVRFRVGFLRGCCQWRNRFCQHACWRHCPPPSQFSA